MFASYASSSTSLQLFFICFPKDDLWANSLKQDGHSKEVALLLMIHIIQASK